MKLQTTILIGGAVLAAGLLVGAAAQDKKPANAGHQDDSMSEMMQMQPVKPTAEHESLKMSEGNWDTLTEGMGPASKGTCTAKLLGGIWLVEDITGEFAHMPFFGHGVTGYDTAKKKYVSSWVDNYGTYLTTSEGTMDPKTHVLTSWMEMPDPKTGKTVKTKMTLEWSGTGTKIMKMYNPGPEGKETAMMTVTYKKRK